MRRTGGIESRDDAFEQRPLGQFGARDLRIAGHRAGFPKKNIA
jgi:hypothetical protein